MMFDESRLQNLASSFFDQQLGAGEKQELEAMLKASSRARQLFLDQAEWHGLAREWALRECSLDIEVPLPSSTRGPRLKFWLGVGLAACFAMAAVIFHFRMNGKEEESAVIARSQDVSGSGDVALLAQSTGVVWESGQFPHRNGSALQEGWIRIREGTLRLDFYSGARVILQGPAALELVSANITRLEKGTLSATVPPPAEGFTVWNGDLKVVDRGTRFGMRAEQAGDCEIHVFDGRVLLQGSFPTSAPGELRKGEAIEVHQGNASLVAADQRKFTDQATLTRVETQETQVHWETWREVSKSFRSTSDLLVYYDFEHLDPAFPIIPNRAQDSNPDSAATVIGCERLPGRWLEKDSVGFTKSTDRVRFRMDGMKTSLTMMAWVRVDSLQLDHNALLSMSADEVGEVHWKFDKSGKLLLGLRASTALDFGSWERLESPRVVTERDFGQWMHFASVIDGEKKVMRHFVNGEEVASGPIKRPTLVRLGLANLGNFDAANAERAKFGTGRSFNGRIDEFALIGRCLSAEEIRKVAR